MNGTEIVVAVLGTAAVVAGAVWGKAWLAQRRQEKELDHKQQMSQEHTRRLELFTQALARQPLLVWVQQGVQAAQIDAVMLRDSISQATVISASAPGERE